jgi:kynurenine formamidase
VRCLIEKRGVTAIGHESMDTDTTEKMESETYILRHGHFHIEVMANPDHVPVRGALIVVAEGEGQPRLSGAGVCNRALRAPHAWPVAMEGRSCGR